MSYSSIALPPSVSASRSARWTARVGTRLPLVVAAVTLILGWGALVLAHVAQRPAVPASVALRTVLADPGLGRMLTRDHWQRVAVTPMDTRYEELAFYRGNRVVATVTVGRSRRGLFLDATDLARQKYAYGSNIANDPRVLGGLAVVFILMTAVWPLWRLRNIDAAVAAGTAMSVVLLNHWTLTRMILVSYPAMIYLALRCAWQALAPPGARLPATPLYEHLTRRWSAEQRVRILRLLVGALALITVFVGVTSLHVLDVGYAVMEGATGLVHGVLHYGHIPDILHGDTYPIASYLAYLPFAVLSPVRSAWDNADATLFVAVGAALVAAWGVWRLTGRAAEASGGLRAGGPRSAPGRLQAAAAFLTFPPLLVTVSTGTTDVVLAALLVWALVLWHRPGWASAALTGAAWFKAAPILALPLLFSPLRGGGLLRALLAGIAVSGVCLGVLLGVGGLSGPGHMLSAMAFQFSRNSPHTLWALVGSVPLQQLAEALTLALVAGAAVKLRRDPGLAGDRTRLAALLAAVFLGLQIAASYWNYMYLVWSLPLLVPALFAMPAPNPARPRRGGLRD